MSEDEIIQTLRNHICWEKSKNVKQAIERHFRFIPKRKREK